MTFPTQFVATGGAVALTPQTVTISANAQNVNVFALAGSPSNPIDLTVDVNAAIVVDSAGGGVALSITGFHPSSIFRLNLLAAALILGHGGDGGQGKDCESDPGGGLCSPASAAGDPGGTAVFCQSDITIDNLGEIRGGGGGGGGGGCGANTSVSSNGGGGGGGVGSDFGTGGLGGQFGVPASPGTDGDSTRPVGNPGSGGAPRGANGGTGGNGADWGVAGVAGVNGTNPGGTNPCSVNGGAGGAAGAAVSITAGTTTFVTMGIISGSVS